jgi:acetyltransferase-like isoleucine patch superfamily enzyme
MVRALLYKLVFKNIGNMCLLGKPIFICGSKNIYIGNRVRIFPGSRLETHNDGKINIGNNTSIGQGFHIISSGDDLTIGNNCLISANVFISNCDHIYGTDDIKESSTNIGNGCFIGYGAVILSGTILGDRCVVGANAVVKGAFSEGCVIAGNPAEIIKKVHSDVK